MSCKRIAVILALSLPLLGACGGREASSSSATSTASESLLSNLISNVRASETSIQPPPDLEALRPVAEAAASVKSGGVVSFASTSTLSKQSGSGPQVNLQAVTVGTWNFFIPSACVAFGNTANASTLTMYMRDGTIIATQDPVAIAALSSACTTAPQVAVFITAAGGGYFSWNYAIIYHL